MCFAIRVYDVIGFLTSFTVVAPKVTTLTQIVVCNFRASAFKFSQEVPHGSTCSFLALAHQFSKMSSRMHGFITVGLGARIRQNVSHVCIFECFLDLAPQMNKMISCKRQIFTCGPWHLKSYSKLQTRKQWFPTGFPYHRTQGPCVDIRMVF